MGFCQNLIWGWFVNQFGYWGLFIELSVKMDLGEKAEFSSEKRNEEHMNYHSSSMSPSWQFGASNLTDQPMGLLPISTFAPNSSGDAVASSSIWGNPNSQNLGLSGSTNVGKGVAPPILDTSRTGSDKEHGLDWNLPNSMPKGSAFLSQFPTDSGFIERAARFSCFTGGAFTDMLNPFSMSESMDRRFKDGQLIQVPPQVVLDDGMNLNPTSAAQSPMNDQNRNEIAKYTVVPVERGAPEGSPAEKLSRVGSFVRPVSEEKQELGVNSNESYEEASGSGGQGEPTSRKASSSKAFGLRKRKDSGQGNETDKDETPKEARETKQKNDHNQTPNAKASKHSKVNSPNSDAPKEDYIHVRARRGQATNSHSLAERVRREKISERMKYLQDLVPGCSKVTGKAVMLDEIINYVQSLQRQVEFLSMKLASVNPRLDLNTEALLAKDVREALQSRGGSSSSTFPFPQDPRLVHPQPHPSQQGFIQPRIPGMENPSDALRRTSYSQLIAINEGYKGPAAQIPNIWDDELNNVLQMNFGTSPAFNGQDSTASEPPGDMKDEL